MREPCFQCDLDIPHVCYYGVPDARWGLHDGAIAALEAAHRHLSGGGTAKKRMASTAKKRRSSR